MKSTDSIVKVAGRIMIDPKSYVKHNPEALLSLLECDEDVMNHEYWRRWRRSQSSLELTNSPGNELTSADIFQTVDRASGLTISDSQAIIATPHVYGFALMEKIWVRSSVENIEEIDWDQKCFDKLALDIDTKNTLQRLVQLHESSRKYFKDVIARKGAGRAFLLHGPPGCGKTLTAGTLLRNGMSTQ